MRRAVLAVLIAFVAAIGVFALPASAAAAGPKVVIIVGPTHGSTAGYRADANKAYAEAIKYTANVVKVYSPNATWSKVKAAVKGASVVIYLGHGNGWPSPYTYDPKYTTKDGFGLNASAGHGDSNTKYYGEPYVSTLDLAPNAVVILSHLCYASGNSEPGNAAPSKATARKRVVNFAAGFLHAAEAVIADGHGNPEPYIRALFTTHATIEGVWRGAPNYHDHESSFPSTRTSGATAYTDTDSSTSGYYRSLVTRPGLTTDMVTGASYADTGADPATLVVPGNAQVGADGATLYADDGTADGSIPAGARLRVLQNGNTLSATGTASVLVEGVDDASVTGWVSTEDLIPRDSAPPVVWGLDKGTGVFSPNGDGRFDAAALSGRFSESVDWRVRFLDGDTVLAERTGTGSTFDVAWDGLQGGTPLPDGDYAFSIRAQDAWGNGPTTKTGSLTIDTVPAELASVTPDADADRWFSPNGDTSRESISWTATTAEPGSLVVRAYDSDDHKVYTSTEASSAGANTVRWSGVDDDGHVVPDGTYTVKVTPRDVAGTSGTTVSRTVRVDTTLGAVSTSRAAFYPYDDDSLGRSTSLGFTLARPATVTWTILDAAGTTQVTLLQDQASPAGRVTRVFNGRRTDGTRLPKGRYTSLVSATHGAITVSQSVSFEMNAFAITASDTTPKRGQTITVYATSGEPLSARPRLFVKQPGKASWSALMTKTSTYGYRVTIKLKTGSAGTVTFKVVGVDKIGQRQRTSVSYPIH